MNGIILQAHVAPRRRQAAQVRRAYKQLQIIKTQHDPRRLSKFY